VTQPAEDLPAAGLVLKSFLMVHTEATRRSSLRSFNTLRVLVDDARRTPQGRQRSHISPATSDPFMASLCMKFTARLTNEYRDGGDLQSVRSQGACHDKSYGVNLLHRLAMSEALAGSKLSFLKPQEGKLSTLWGVESATVGHRN
jgi:hypothetical protein